MIQGHHISHGYKVQNMRMLASLKQVDVGVLCVFRFRTKRSVYVSCTIPHGKKILYLLILINYKIINYKTMKRQS